MLGLILPPLLAIVFGIIFWKKFVENYPIEVVIAEQRGNSIRWDFDRARKLKRKDGTEAYQLKKRKEVISPPDYKHLHITRNGKSILPLFCPQSDQYVPMDVDLSGNPIELQAIDKEISFWNILEHRRTREIYPKKESFFVKYMPYIFFAITAGMLVFIVIFLGSKLVEMAGSINSAANAFKSAAEILAKKPPTPAPLS